MPIKVKLTRAVDIVMGTVIGLLFLSLVLFMLTISRSFSTGNTGNDYTGFTGVPDDTDAVTRQLHYTSEYYSYKDKLDSIERRRDLLLKPLHLTEGFLGNSVFAMITHSWCDTCNYKASNVFYDKMDNKHAGWLVLYGYTPVMKDKRDQRNGIHPIYYGYKGQFYKAYVQWDSTHKKNHAESDFGHWTKQRIQYFLQDPILKAADGARDIVVPISNGIKNLFYGISIIWVLLMLTLFLVSARNIIQVLIQISVGKAFSLVNCNRLRYAAYSILLMTIVILLTHIVLYLCFKSYLNGDWVPVIDWGGTIADLLVGVVIWLIARAFLKGYNIQQEQDLTI